MREIWLKTNQRPLILGLVVAALIEAAGMILVVLSFALKLELWGWIPGGILMAVGTLSILVVTYRLQLPRLAREGNNLLVYLDAPRPTEVPLEIVECFFMGQGPSMLPNIEGKEAETSNVIVRLAESAQDWRHKDIDPNYGHWCEGYITLRGAWCEPLSNEALKDLNHKLVLAHREQKQAAGGKA